MAPGQSAFSALITFFTVVGFGPELVYDGTYRGFTLPIDFEH